MLNSIRSRLAGLAFVAAAGVVIASVLALSTVSTVGINGTLGQQIRKQGAIIQDAYPPRGFLGQVYSQYSRLKSETEPAQIQAAGAKLAAQLNAFYAVHQQWKDEVEPGPLKDALTTRLFATGDAIAKLLNKELIPAARKGENAASQLLEEELAPLLTEHEKASEDIAKVLEDSAAELDAKVGAINKQRTTTLWVGSGVLALFVLGLAGLIYRGVVPPLRRMLSTINDMTQGSRDLTQRVDDARNDELGQLGKAFNTFVSDLNSSNAKAKEASDRVEADAKALQEKVEQMLTVTDAAGNGDFTVKVPVTGEDAIGRLADGFRRMLEKISDLIRQTASGANQIDAGAQQIAGGSQTLASGASQQAASLEEISASLEEITSMTTQNADNAQQASALSGEAQKAADRGKNQTGELSVAMKQIQESADKVSVIIKTIDDIAFQTNLLALNAAVEAARAGEAGKGFAVVAEEVRNLAQRSAEAAKNTAALIQDSKTRADAGVAIAKGMGSALEEIVTGSSKVNTLLNEIASASREQAQGVSQVNKGVTELDKVTQQNAGNSEELASAAQETASQVACLRDLVGRFKVDGGEAKSDTTPDHTAATKPAASRTTPAARSKSPTAPRKHPAPSTPPTSEPVAAAIAGDRDVSPKHAIPFEEGDETFEKF